MRLAQPHYIAEANLDAHGQYFTMGAGLWQQTILGISDACVQNEAAHKRWRKTNETVGALGFWEDTLRYLFLPRLKTRSVLEQAALPPPVPASGESYTYPTSSTPTYIAVRETSTPYTVDGAAKAHTFIGTVEVNATTAKMRLVQIAEEIVNVLASDSQATVTVSVEINAEFPLGVCDSIKRAVSENAASLGFRNKTWE